MLTATIAGRTVALHGCDDMIHAEKFAAFPTTNDVPDQVITVIGCDERQTAPVGTHIGSDGMVDSYRLSDGDRQLFHRQGLFSLTFNEDFSSVTLRLYGDFKERDILRYLYVSQCIAYHALAHGAIVFHGAGWLMNGKVTVVAGDSGTGKTTLTDRLTAQNPSVTVLSDETVVVTKDGDTWIAHGTPLCGQDHRFAAVSAPLSGVVLLARGEDERFYKPPASSAVFRLLAATLRPVYHEALCTTALDRVIELLQTVPVHCFDHTAGAKALTTLSDALSAQA